jgi:hypothetical protein
MNASTTNSSTSNAQVANNTTTNSQTANASTTNSSTTNADTGVIASLYASSTVGDSATITNATTTNLSATNASLTNATNTNLFAVNASISNATTNSFFTNLFSALTAAFTDLTATNGTITNATATNLAVSATTTTTGLSATFANLLSAFIGTLFGNTGNFITMNASTSNSSTTNTLDLVATNGTITNATATNLFANTTQSLSATIGSLTSTTTTSLASTTLQGTAIAGIFIATTSLTSQGTLAVVGTSTLATTSITGPLTLANYQQGRLLFPTTTGEIVQDDALFWNEITNSLGLGTLTPGAMLDITQGALGAGGSPAFKITSNWNSGADTFKAITVDVTDTASAAASKLIELMVGGVAKFTVNKSGDVYVGRDLNIVGTTTANNVIDMNSNKIINLVTPTNPNDAANKSYVDSYILGLSWQDSILSFATTSYASTTGDRYIISAGAIGFGACAVDDIAENIGGGVWTCFTPATGTTAFVDSYFNQQYTYNNSSWVSIGSTVSHNSTTGIQGGNGADQFYHLNLADYTALTGVSAQLSELASTGSPAFVDLTLTGEILTGDGSAATPSYSFSSDANTGIYRAGVDQIGFSTGGVLRTTIDAAGRFGIGNATPAFALDVVGDGYFTNNIYAQNIYATGTITSALTNGYVIRGSATNTTEATSTLFIANTGRIGIGTTSPLARLHIDMPQIIGLAKFRVGSSTDDADFIIANNGGVHINGTTTGNVALGVMGRDTTTYVSTTLSAAHDGAVRLFQEDYSTDNNFSSINFTTRNNAGVTTQGAALTAVHTSRAAGLLTDFAFQLRGSSGVFESLRLTNSGRVGIGTTSPGSTLSLVGTTGLLASTTATSTFQGGGINLTTSAGNTGCYAINGTCLTTASQFSTSTATNGITFATATNVYTLGGTLNQNTSLALSGFSLTAFGGNSFFSSLFASTTNASTSNIGTANITTAQVGTQYASTTYASTSYTTNAFATTSSSTNINGINLFASNATATKLIFTSATGTNATITNLSVSNLQSGLTNGFVYRGSAANLSEATSTLFIANTGRIGIGTTSPITNFSVAGQGVFNNVWLGTNGGNTISNFSDALYLNGLSGFVRMMDPSNFNTGFIFDAVNRTVNSQVAGVAASMSLQTNGGNVGIGTTTPGGKLAITANANGSGPGLLIDAVTRAATENVFYLNANVSSRDVVLTAGGSLGLGTTTPSAIFSLAGSTGILASTTGTSTFQGGGINLTTAAGNTGCYAINGVCVASAATANAFVNNGNSFGGLATLGTNDANALAFETSGTERVRIDVSGNVGVGTTTPNSRLTTAYFSTAAGLATSGTTDSNQAFTIVGTNVGASGYGLSAGVSSATGAVLLQARDMSNFATNGNIILQPNGGNVGIGTSSPSSKLTVNGAGGDGIATLYDGGTYGIRGLFQHMGNLSGINGVGGLQIAAQGTNNSTSGSGDINFFVTSANSAGAFTDASYTTAMKIRYNGNVGIGTSTPNSKLQVIGGNVEVGPSYGSGVAYDTGNRTLQVGTYTGTPTITLQRHNVEQFNISVNALGSTEIGNAGGTRLTLQTVTGNLGIGTTSPGALLALTGTTGILASTTGTSTFQGGGINLTTAAGNTGCYAINGVCVASAATANAFVQNGNSFGALARIGTNDANDLAFETNALVRATIDASGNFGLGTTTPGGKFAIQGGSNNSGTTLYINERTRNDSDNAIYVAGGTAPNDFVVKTSGRVGIGTTTPLTPLQVEGVITGVSTASSYLIKQGLANTGLYIEADGSLSNFVGGNRIITATSTGNVGIGTAAPGTKLEVVDTNSIVTSRGTAGYGAFYAVGSGANPGYVFLGNASGEKGRIQANDDSALTFSNTIGAVERMRITATGNVGIGTNAPSATLHLASTSVGALTYPLLLSNVNGTAGTEVEIRFQPSATETRYSSISSINDGANNTSLRFLTGSAGTLTENIRIDALTNRVGIGNSSPGQKLDVTGTIRQSAAVSCSLQTNASGDIICISDQNLKHDIEDYSGGLEALRTITPSRFKYNGENYEHLGFIAQNVRSVLPEATPEQAGGHLGLDTTAILSASVSAIQELDINLESIATSSVIEEGSYAERFFDALFVRISDWLASAGNGIRAIMVSEEICIDGECLDKQDILDLKSQIIDQDPPADEEPTDTGGGAENGSGGDTPPPAGDDTPTEGDTPPTEEVPPVVEGGEEETTPPPAEETPAP